MYGSGSSSHGPAERPNTRLSHGYYLNEISEITHPVYILCTLASINTCRPEKYSEREIQSFEILGKTAIFKVNPSELGK